MTDKKYNDNLDLIKEYYGVSNECAEYLFYRSYRSKCKGLKFLKWNIKLQNAIVKADKCIGINWNNLIFGQEENDLCVYGIDVSKIDNDTFRWCIHNEKDYIKNDEWTIVINKKQNFNKFKKIQISGLIL